MTAIEIARLVEEAGGHYRGIQPGTARIPDQILFNDPDTHTTLAVPVKELTKERVKSEIARRRRTWQFWERKVEI